MKRLLELFEDRESVTETETSFLLGKEMLSKNDSKKKKIHIIAIGDVGGTLALGLKLLGGEVISQIGLFDINEKNSARYEFELNQINSCLQDENEMQYDEMPREQGEMRQEFYDFPNVSVIREDELFDCDILLFCATLGIPKIGEEKGEQKDVRMVQLERNKGLVKIYAKQAIEKNYEGKFYVVSDPVDPLCKAAYEEGLKREQVRGFGLGVMNARANYYSQKSKVKNIEIYHKEGRAFGPHGGGLIIANSIKNYDEEASLWLTQKAETANLEMRELGFKPFIAPAISSGAISIIDLLKGKWNYSSICFGSAFWGCRNRENREYIEIENPQLDERLMDRIKKSYLELSKY